MTFSSRLFWFSLPPKDDDRPFGETRHTTRFFPTDDTGHVVEPVVERLRAGDERALREVWDAHSTRMRMVADRYMGSDDAAADVVQHVFIAMWERRETLSPRQTLAAHLIGAVRFRALHELRQMRIRDRATAKAGATMDEERFALNVADAQLDVADTRAAIQASLATLTPRVREIFLLHRDGGLSAPQIAESLGIGTQVVYNQLSKALKALAAGLRTVR